MKLKKHFQTLREKGQHLTILLKHQSNKETVSLGNTDFTLTQKQSWPKLSLLVSKFND